MWVPPLPEPAELLIQLLAEPLAISLCLNGRPGLLEPATGDGTLSVHERCRLEHGDNDQSIVASTARTLDFAATVSFSLTAPFHTGNIAWIETNCLHKSLLAKSPD